VRVGLIDGQYVINPTNGQNDESKLSLYVVGSRDAITMVEGHAREASNQEMIDGIFFGQEHIRKIVEFQEAVLDGIRKPPRAFEPPVRDAELAAKVTAIAEAEVRAIARETDKARRKERNSALLDRIVAETGVETTKLGEVKALLKEMSKREVRSNILKDNFRIDGRKDTDIREITCETGLLPRAHGSALFTRGQTQALSAVTLGTKEDEQKIDNLDEDGYRKYMLHYNFPPYSTGEVKNSFGVSRREIGHGKLGERALEAVLPDWDEFPYTVRVVSEILESNGSSSMATVCAGSLALMDAGVPVHKAVAGIAMGLIKEGDDYRILTDILGDEDHLGDMDFKVAGTRDGITAFQMDIKIKGITPEIMSKALTQARDARHQILDAMDRCIDRPNGDISPFAPKFITLKIPTDRIGALIGPGGKNIRQIIADTGCTIDVEDDGTVRIGGTDGPSSEEARRRVELVAAVPEVGKIYNGTIKRIMDFGAFVEILPGTEGLMHVSQIDLKRVDRVGDYFQVGDKVEVKLLKIEADGKLDLSRKVLLAGYDPANDVPRERRPPRDDHRGGRNGGGRDGGRFRR
ncbi:MAG: polyribonucleotide nucleotidyltransferase, partial [Calditrichaeota bacterium]|nr:polyribonucleotide nucleotidyltransferase [Calditrichota bacterium]